MFYSASTGGFYLREIHGDSIPHDAVEITAEEHRALLDGQADKEIVPDEHGRPVLRDRAVTFNQQAAFERLRALRSPILNALVGVGFDAVAADDQATVDAVTAARQGLRDLPQLPSVLAAASDDEFDAAVMARYRELSAAAPENVRTAFKELA